MRASVAKLIGHTIEYDSIGQAFGSEVVREILCDVASVTRLEWMQAGQLGVNAQLKLVTPSINYQGETEAEYEGSRYGIYRAYSDGDIIELYLERKAGK